MQSKEIIQNIHSIYDEYDVPKNVRLHMMRVAGVSEFLCDNLKPKIDPADLVAVSLIHDLGNIVKMDFSSREKIKLLSKNDKKNIEFLRKKQKLFWKKYGKDDNRANERIAEELGASRRVQYLLKHKGIDNQEKNFWTDDLELMILFYADGRVSPKGVRSVKGRINEYAKRYNFHKDPAKMENSKKFTEFSLEVEKRIFSKMKLKPSYINDKTINTYVKKYKLIDPECD